MPVAAALDRLADEAVLDVHVIGVEVGVEVWAGRCGRAGPRTSSAAVDDVGLVAVHDLDADLDVEGLRLLADAVQHLDDVGHAALRPSAPCISAGRNGSRRRNAWHARSRTTETAVLSRSSPRLTASGSSSDVGGCGKPERGRGAQSRVPRAARGVNDDGAVRVEQWDLDEVVAQLGRAADRPRALVLAPAADPDEGVNAQLARRLSLLRSAAPAPRGRPARARDHDRIRISPRCRREVLVCAKHVQAGGDHLEGDEGDQTETIRPKPPNGSTRPRKLARTVTRR